MKPPVILLADAVTAYVTTLALAAAERVYQVVRTLEELKLLRVTVVPAGVAGEMLTRGGAEMATYRLHLGVQKREARREELDALLGLVQSVIDACRQRPAPGAEWAACTGYEWSPLYDHAHLQAEGVFTSLVTLIYQTKR